MAKIAWEGYIRALHDDPAGVAAVLSIPIKVTDYRRKQIPHPEVELAWVIEVESQWRPDAVNPSPKSGATGLIQFMPDTARTLGTTTKHLKTLSRSEQAPWVKKYFDRVNKTAIYPGDIYMMVAAPAFTGQPDDTIVYAEGSEEWRENPGWRPPGGGSITAGSIRRRGIPPTMTLPGAGTPLPNLPKSTPAGSSGWLFLLLGLGLAMKGSLGGKKKRRKARRR